MIGAQVTTRVYQNSRVESGRDGVRPTAGWDEQNDARTETPWCARFGDRRSVSQHRTTRPNDGAAGTLDAANGISERVVLVKCCRPFGASFSGRRPAGVGGGGLVWAGVVLPA